MPSLYPMLFEPIYKPIIWGGEMMRRHLGRELPETGDGVPIAESWELSDRPDGQSVVANGELAGRTINELLAEYGAALMGDSFQGDRFPLLVKIIDAGQRLSLQVHPDENACRALGGGAEPKTEMWYVIAAERGAKIIAGLRPHTTKRIFIDSIARPEVEDCLQTFDSVPGDAYFINAGRIHAIDAGNLILEIQQNSNTTYRISDWGRVDAKGKPRELHIEQAMECVDFMDRTSPRISGASDATGHNRKFPMLKTCPFFKVDDLRLAQTWRDSTAPGASFHLVTPINGDILVASDKVSPVKVPRGATSLIPANLGDYQIEVPPASQTTVVRATL